MHNNFVGVWSQALGEKEASQGRCGFNVTCLDRRLPWVHDAERHPLRFGAAGHGVVLWSALCMVVRSRASALSLCCIPSTQQIITGLFLSRRRNEVSACWPQHLQLGVCVVRQGGDVPPRGCWTPRLGFGSWQLSGGATENTSAVYLYLVQRNNTSPKLLISQKQHCVRFSPNRCTVVLP